MSEEIINISDGWQRRRTDEIGVVRKFAIFGLICMSGPISNGTLKGDYHKAGKMFGFVDVKTRKVFDRFADFDSGWSYQSYWKGWKEKWVFEKII